MPSKLTSFQKSQVLRRFGVDIEFSFLARVSILGINFQTFISHQKPNYISLCQLRLNRLNLECVTMRDF